MNSAKMNCQEFLEEMSAYFDNELDSSARERCQEHERSCIACRNELERTRRADDLLGIYTAPKSPTGFVEKVSAASSNPQNHSAASRNWWKAAAIFVLALGAVGAFFWVSPSNHKAEEVVVQRENDEAVIENLEVLENWDLLQDEALVAALNLPEEQFSAVLNAAEEGL